MVNLLGADDDLTEIRSPLVEPGYEHASLNMLRGCLSQACNWDWIQWSGISSALAQAMPADVQHQPHEARDDYVLDLAPNWPQFHARLRRNVRESLRHCYNSLRRDGLAFEFVVARGSAEIHSALDRFLQLHTLRARMPWGPKHPDRFKDPAARAFLHEVCGRLAARDVARVFQLQIGGQIVAARVGFAVGNSLYLYYSGFDPHWARYSVMTTTLAETLKYAISEGLSTVNLSPTAEQSKLRWRPRMVLFQSARTPRGSFRSHAAYLAYWLARSGARAAAGRLSRRN
jgi:CelD/BcsL family acetyltransferase involved in cellulose biosynthesis